MDFSRKVMWLCIYDKHDPLVIANYFKNCIDTYQFCSNLLRIDHGTENIYSRPLRVFSGYSIRLFCVCLPHGLKRFGLGWRTKDSSCALDCCLQLLECLERDCVIFTSLNFLKISKCWKLFFGTSLLKYVRTNSHII